MEVKKIRLSDVRMNQENLYFEEQNIQELADSIKTYGQLENATVYQDTTIQDGKIYTLVGGHRRFLAISYLAERGEFEPYILVQVIDKPSVEEEPMLIIADNQQREKDRNTRIREIKVANDYYNYLISIDRKPSGKRRTWIAKKIGIGERQVQDILTSIKRNLENSSSNGSTNIQAHDIDEVKKYVTQALRKIQKAKQISSTYGVLGSEQHNFLNELQNEIGVLLERLGN